MSKQGVVSVSCMRRQCGTCEQWQGERSIELGDKEKIVVANERGGECRDGAWRDFITLPRQTCDQYYRWKALLDVPSDPAVLSTISQMHREIRMHSHSAGKLPDELRVKLDDLLWEIECWHLRRHLVDESKEEPEREWFFSEYVAGLFDCFYYFGWSYRKPISEMSLEDIWPL